MIGSASNDDERRMAHVAEQLSALAAKDAAIVGWTTPPPSPNVTSPDFSQRVGAAARRPEARYEWRGERFCPAGDRWLRRGGGGGGRPGGPMWVRPGGS